MLMFCSKVYHQFFRKGYTSLSEFIISDLLQIPYNTLLSRYSRLMTVFLISAFQHVAHDLAPGKTGFDTGSMVFFPLQALGIMVEDLVQYLFRDVCNGKRRYMKRVVGYVWVFVWFMVFMPIEHYPWLRNIPGQMSLMPFSLFGRKLSMTSKA